MSGSELANFQVKAKCGINAQRTIRLVVFQSLGRHFRNRYYGWPSISGGQVSFPALAKCVSRQEFLPGSSIVSSCSHYHSTRTDDHVASGSWNPKAEHFTTRQASFPSYIHQCILREVVLNLPSFPTGPD